MGQKIKKKKNGKSKGTKRRIVKRKKKIKTMKG